MKRIISLIIVIALVLTMLPLTNLKTARAELPALDYTVSPRIKSIKIKIGNYKNMYPRVEDAAYYKVFRASPSNKYIKKHTLIPFKKFKRVAKIKKSFIDKKVKKGKKYFYWLKAYNKKGKLLGKDDFVNQGNYHCIGKPKGASIDMAWDDENNYSAKKLFLELSTDISYVIPNRYYIYRKKVGAKNFKLIKILKNKVNSKNVEYNDGRMIVTDKTVKPGEKYCYKTKSCYKTGKKKYFSKMSKSIKIRAVKYYADYKIKCLTEAGDDVKSFIFKIQNNGKGNGDTKIHPYLDYNESCYQYQKTKKSKLSTYEIFFVFTKYSYDNKKWHYIKSKGIKLPDKKPLYIKTELESDYYEKIPFGGSSAYRSYLEINGIFSYSGASMRYGPASGGIDLKKGSGSVHNTEAD
ncbi:MAG: hypothetical protein K6G11_08935 [Lachnospiraceae bacterium]|nr:hypothetical protein [Lachnospiraceae bacterium]